MIREIGTSASGYTFSDYTDVPVGRGVFEIFAGQEKQPLASLSAELFARSYRTLLLSEPLKAGDPPSLELIDDGYADSAAPAQISVCSFVRELKGVRITIGDKLSAQFDAGAGYLLMRNLVPAFYRVQTTGTMTNGEPFDWTTEIDLRQNRRQTLLIYPDPYGRIRPRISVDGEMRPAEEPEKQSSQR